MRIRVALPVGGALLALLLMPAVASAHEQRDVGSYHFVVGFLNEPAIQDQMNSIDLTVTNPADKSPVTGLEKTLKAEVIVGGNAKSMPLTLANRGSALPGKYAGYFMPTATGSYTFHITGAINGQQVDQKFESGPNTFSDVEPLANYQFPDKLTDAATLQSQVGDAQSAATQSRTLGILGLIVGAIGVAVGAYGLSRRREAGVTGRATAPSPGRA